MVFDEGKVKRDEKGRFAEQNSSSKAEENETEIANDYVVKVKNGNEFIDLNINVGFHKQFRDWHIYIINVKEKSDICSGTI